MASDRLTQIGKYMRGANRNSNLALKRVHKVLPSIERARDTLSDEITFKMGFQVQPGSRRMKMALKFDKPPPAPGGQFCGGSICQDYPGVIGTATLSTQFPYFAGTLRVYVNGEVYDQSKWYEESADGGQFYIQLDELSFVVACYTYDSCTHKTDQEPGNWPPGGAVDVPDLPFTPDYLPIFRPQMGDPTTTLDPYLCTMESGAMLLDWQTRGGIQVWGGELVTHSKRLQSTIVDRGTNLFDLGNAWAYYGQYLDNRSGGTWSDVMACLDEGRGVVLQGDYEEFPSGVKCQSNFTGDHAILLLPATDGTTILTGDPLCNTYHMVEAGYLKAFGENFGQDVFGSSSPQRLLFAVSAPWAI